MQVTVVITSFNDLRILKTIDSLLQQTRAPDHIFIADGGSPPDIERKMRDYIKSYNTIQFAHLPGRCLDTRRRAIDELVFRELYFKSDILAWIDADEKALQDWLQLLIAPIEAGEADFTGGPWKPTIEKSKPEKILNIIQTKNQELAAKDQTYIAMGNSAWKTDIFKKIGNFDDSSDSQTADALLAKEGIVAGHYVSEDFDLSLRAKNAGFRSRYVPDAIVYHDQSHVNTYKKLNKYFYNNYVRTGMAYFKNKKTLDKFVFASRQPIAHPYEGFLLMLKPVALIHAWKETKCAKKEVR
jgi:GT2 family glycosyltransferase